MDKDKNGLISEIELKDWIKYVQDRYVIKDTDDRWKEYELKTDKLDWENFKKRTYGFTEEGIFILFFYFYLVKCSNVI